MRLTRAIYALTMIMVVPLAAACGSASTPEPPDVAAALPASQKPDSCKGYVGLTFDDGPTKLTDQYLVILDFYDVHATFFVVGQNVKDRPEQAKHIAEAGHELGNHTFDHADLTELTEDERAAEFAQSILAHEELGLEKFTFWRPPYGATTPEISKEAEALGMAEVQWDLDSKDYMTPEPEKVVAQSAGMKDGDIILLHDGKPQTLAALPTIINRYYAEGLCFGKLARTDKDRKATNGKMYAVHAVAP